MEGREFKDAIYAGLSKLMKALSGSSRLEIIEILAQGEKSVEAIVQVTGLTFANASQHLQVMKNNNILKSRKEGHYMYYSLVSDELLILYQQITRYAINELAELEKIIKKQREKSKSQDAVSLEELNLMIENDNVVLMDVRPATEYVSGHIKGAISVPIPELITQLNKLPKNKEIIAYCRGPFCILADEAVKILNENGFRIRRLHEGYPEWKLMQPKP